MAYTPAGQDNSILSQIMKYDKSTRMADSYQPATYSAPPPFGSQEDWDTLSSLLGEKIGKGIGHAGKYVGGKLASGAKGLMSYLKGKPKKDAFTGPPEPDVVDYATRTPEQVWADLFSSDDSVGSSWGQPEVKGPIDYVAKTPEQLAKPPEQTSDYSMDSGYAGPPVPKNYISPKQAMINKMSAKAQKSSYEVAERVQAEKDEKADIQKRLADIVEKLPSFEGPHKESKKIHPSHFGYGGKGQVVPDQQIRRMDKKKLLSDILMKYEGEHTPPAKTLTKKELLGLSKGEGITPKPYTSLEAKSEISRLKQLREGSRKKVELAKKKWKADDIPDKTTTLDYVTPKSYSRDTMTSLSDWVNIYSPASDRNDPEQITADLYKMTGYSKDTPFHEMDAEVIADAQTTLEGGTGILRNNEGDLWHNPGNLEYKKQPGSYKDPTTGMAVFESAEAGRRAHIKQIKKDQDRAAHNIGKQQSPFYQLPPLGIGG